MRRCVLIYLFFKITIQNKNICLKLPSACLQQALNSPQFPKFQMFQEDNRGNSCSPPPSETWKKIFIYVYSKNDQLRYEYAETTKTFSDIQHWYFHDLREIYS